jgi:hypothetical protein
LSPDEAHVKCVSISQDVCQRLFGEQALEVTLRNLVSEVAVADLPKGVRMGHALDRLLETTGTETIVSGRPDQTSTSEGGAHQADHAGPETDVVFVSAKPEFVYRPIWDAAKQVVVTYICQPKMSAAQEARSGFCTTEKEDEQSGLDVTVLLECAQRASRLRRDGLRILMAVPLAFATLSRPRYWSSYCNAYRTIEADVARDLSAIVFGIDAGVPAIRLGQELPKLAGMMGNFFCAVSEVSGGTGTRFRGTGAGALGIAIAPSEPEKNSIELLRRLRSSCRDAALESFVLDVRTTSLALNAIGSGIRYLEGPAIRAASADPQYAFSQPLEYLYAAKLTAHQPA